MTKQLWNFLVMSTVASTPPSPPWPTPPRRATLARLVEGDATVTELAAPFAMSQPAAPKHLKVLERAGLVSRGRDAQRRPTHLEAGPLADATGWLEGYRRFWEQRYGQLDALLDRLQEGDG